ncbi:MAG TPA: AgmX/PglI C-terminal domain-containing protein [Steroidobacteraceae bacterium]|nr:AgmX/PglI C-terminal domain-containing protein [Steroidobacteraceae bacterium]
MNYALAPYYRSFRLWDLDTEQDRAFRKLWTTLLAAGVVLALLFTLIPMPERSQLVQETIPPRLARIVIERELPPPPPPPPPPVEEPSPEEQPRPEPVPQPEQRQEQARRRAEAQLANVRDELASIRQALAEPVGDTRNLTGAVGAESRAERSLITSRAGTGSAGVSSTGTSGGFGAGVGALAGHDTGIVQSNVASAGAGANVSRAGSGKAGRSAEEIEQEFDRNKGAIYALYIRALREQADLQGKVVLEFTIAPEGVVSACRVVSSELNNPELEGRICTRVRSFRFPARDVAAVTTTKPIDFFPQG